MQTFWVEGRASSIDICALMQVVRANLRAYAMLAESNLMENASVNTSLKPNYDTANIHIGYSSIKVFRFNQQTSI